MAEAEISAAALGVGSEKLIRSIPSAPTSARTAT